VLVIAQCGDSRKDQAMGIYYPIWKNLTSYSGRSALNLHSKIRLKRVSDLNILIQPFSSTLRQVLLRHCEAGPGCGRVDGDVPSPCSFSLPKSAGKLRERPGAG